MLNDVIYLMCLGISASPPSFMYAVEKEHDPNLFKDGLKEFTTQWFPTHKRTLSG